MQILQSHHGPMLGYGFILLRGENTPTTCRQSRKEKNKTIIFISICDEIQMCPNFTFQLSYSGLQGNM